MGIKNLQIILDNATAIFAPGDLVNGRVLILVGNPVKIKRIKLKLNGEANVTWNESRKNIKNETEKYTAKEEFINNKIILAGGEGKINLKGGEHVYPFSVTLPDQLPSTFKDEYGCIQYIANVVVDISWDMKKGKEITFEVISAINLNDTPSLAEPKIQEKQKFFCCCCCKSGPMTIVVYVPCTGFVPGQSIPVTIELDNNSNVAIDCVKINLEKKLKYKARFPNIKIKTNTIKVADACVNGIEKHTSKTWTEQIKIPSSLVVPNLKYCGIITDTYLLNVEACVNDTLVNEVTSFNITLGNIPLTTIKDGSQLIYSFQSSDQK